MSELLAGIAGVFYVLSVLLSVCGLFALVLTAMAAAVVGALTLAAAEVQWDGVVRIFAVFLALTAVAMILGGASWLLKMAVPYVA